MKVYQIAKVLERRLPIGKIRPENELLKVFELTNQPQDLKLQGWKLLVIHLSGTSKNGVGYAKPEG